MYVWINVYISHHRIASHHARADPSGSPFSSPCSIPWSIPCSSPFISPFSNPCSSPFISPFSSPCPGPYHGPYDRPYDRPYRCRINTHSSRCRLCFESSDPAPLISKLTQRCPAAANQNECLFIRPIALTFDMSVNIDIKGEGLRPTLTTSRMSVYLSDTGMTDHATDNAFHFQSRKRNQKHNRHHYHTSKLVKS